MRFKRFIIFFIALFTAIEGGSSLAAEVLPGPVSARVVQVLDGDTLLVDAKIWLGQTMRIKIRLLGVDTPEMKGRCPAEREKALQARSHVSQQIGDVPVRLKNIRYGKYAGRVLAQVTTGAGIDLSNDLLQQNLGQPYQGGRRQSWCPKTTADTTQ